MSFCKKKMEKHYEKKEICFGVKIEKKYSNYLVENNFIMFKNQKIGYILQKNQIWNPIYKTRAKNNI
jgi:hypothetical protein